MTTFTIRPSFYFSLETATMENVTLRDQKIEQAYNRWLAAWPKMTYYIQQINSVLPWQQKRMRFISII